MTGELKLGAVNETLDSLQHPSHPCKGHDEFADIEAGAQVVLTDNKGATIGLSQLEEEPGRTRDADCYFSFTITDVPTGKRFYGVKIAGHAMPQVTEAQVKSKLSLKLGKSF